MSMYCCFHYSYNSENLCAQHSTHQMREMILILLKFQGKRGTDLGMVPSRHKLSGPESSLVGFSWSFAEVERDLQTLFFDLEITLLKPFSISIIPAFLLIYHRHLKFFWMLQCIFSTFMNFISHMQNQTIKIQFYGFSLVAL